MAVNSRKGEKKVPRGRRKILKCVAIGWNIPVVGEKGVEKGCGQREKLRVEKIEPTAEGERWGKSPGSGKRPVKREQLRNSGGRQKSNEKSPRKTLIADL